jgi:hypothetical protein
MIKAGLRGLNCFVLNKNKLVVFDWFINLIIIMYICLWYFIKVSVIFYTIIFFVFMNQNK